MKLIPGGRGAGKDIKQDIQEAIDSLERWKAMREEDGTPATEKPIGPPNQTFGGVQ